MKFHKQAVTKLLKAQAPEDKEALFSDDSVEVTNFFRKKGKKTYKKSNYIALDDFSNSEKILVDKSQTSIRFAAYILFGLIVWLTILSIVLIQPRTVIENIPEKVQNFSQLVAPIDPGISAGNLTTTTEVTVISGQDELQEMRIFTPIDSELPWYTNPAEMNTLSVVIILILITAFYLADYFGYY